MVDHPIAIGLILAAVVFTARWWHERFANTLLMRILPTPVLCYVPPTLLATAGILPLESPIYDWCTRQLLPACLVLILMTTDFAALKRIGRPAFWTILISSMFVMIAGIGTSFVFRRTLGPETWKAAGTLAASWVGGTANELAVKEATGLSDALFAPLFISDITVVYIWMTLLMIGSGFQTQIDRWIGSDHKKFLSNLETGGLHSNTNRKANRPSWMPIVLLIASGFGLGSASAWIGSLIPEIGMAVTSTTWVILAVTTAGLLAALTPVARRYEAEACSVGYLLFYFVLASTGARANLLAIVKAPLLIVFCLTWAFLYGILMIAWAKIFKTPAALLATASQANLGGVVSAPIVASTYSPALAPLAVLLAIFGYAVGNYLGILTGQVLRWLIP
ncbi:MAG: DUF819 family protein [Candidatus Omnitrophica bacterium]|nr:DUF819 family protein [Candidatus Omnitrophota bacterium]